MSAVEGTIKVRPREGDFVKYQYRRQLWKGYRSSGRYIRAEYETATGNAEFIRFIEHRKPVAEGENLAIIRPFGYKKLIKVPAKDLVFVARAATWEL